MCCQEESGLAATEPEYFITTSCFIDFWQTATRSLDSGPPPPHPPVRLRSGVIAREHVCAACVSAHDRGGKGFIISRLAPFSHFPHANRNKRGKLAWLSFSPPVVNSLVFLIHRENNLFTHLESVRDASSTTFVTECSFALGSALAPSPRNTSAVSIFPPVPRRKRLWAPQSTVGGVKN